MFRLVLAALALSIASPASANMPPKKYDHPYRGHIKMQRYAVAYTDDNAAFRKCAKLYRKFYGAVYNDNPVYGCAMYDEERKIAVIVYTYDTPALAKRRLASKVSRQPYDQCMAFNSYTHERGHLNAYVAGDWRDGHAGWIEGSRCSYDGKAIPVPLS